LSVSAYFGGPDWPPPVEACCPGGYFASGTPIRVKNGESFVAGGYPYASTGQVEVGCHDSGEGA